MKMKKNEVSNPQANFGFQFVLTHTHTTLNLRHSANSFVFFSPTLSNYILKVRPWLD